MPTPAFTPAMTGRGGLTPKPPTHPPERRPRCGLAPLPIPKGGCAKGNEGVFKRLDKDLGEI